MFSRGFLTLLLLAAATAWPQAAPSVTGYGFNTVDGSPMQTPPPVSGQAYPVIVGNESPSNYLRGGIVANAGYNDNLFFASEGTAPTNGMSYSIWPTIVIDKSAPRSQWKLSYSPGFTIYENASAWNQQSHNLSFDSEFRLSPHITMSIQDEFLKSSNILNQANPLSGIEVSGSVQSPFVPVVAPFANQASNIASLELTYQFGSNDMVGGSGTFAFLHYPNPDQAQELYNSSSRGGTAFYNHRLSVGQYFGAIYQFSENLDTPTTVASQIQADTHLHSAMLFYTRYLNSTLSFSVLAGPQHYDVSASPAPPSAAWTPAVTASMAWQGRRTSLAACYWRQINVGGGLLGAFRGNGANISGRWHIARTWSAGLGGSYTNTTNVSSAISLFYPGGNFASGTAEIRNEISDHLSAAIGYTRLHQNYNNLVATSIAPNADRVYVAVSYQFLKSLGR